LDRAPFLSEDLDDLDESIFNMSTYDPLMPERLTEYGVFNEVWSKDVHNVKNSKNLQDIMKAITFLQNGDSEIARLGDEQGFYP
jgi:hypothetical protein